jgi:DNA polymerase III sliding clamp (beta) subunit (PCNA family)
MDRKELIAKLERVSPALASGNLIPIMRHFWFTGSHLMAYNDQIAIATPFETEFKGAVLGDTIVNLLKASGAKDVKVEPDDNGNLSIKAASARLRLPLLPPEDFIFKMPALPKSDSIMLPGEREAFLEALEMGLMCVSTDTSKPDQLGVTIIPSDGKLLFGATNFASMVFVHMKSKAAPHLKERVILPTAFVQQIIKLAKDNDAALFIMADHALFTDGETTVFGRLIESDDPVNFERLANENLPANHKKIAVPIPNNLRLILDRAVIVCDATMNQHKTQISVADGRALFYSKSERGEVKDEIKADVDDLDAIMVEPKLLRNACDRFDDYILSDKCVALLRPDMLYLVAVNR